MKAQSKLKGGAILLVGALLVVAVVAVFSGCTTTSSDVTTTVFDPGSQYNYYALFIGINEYSESVGPLNYCVSDATKLRNSVVNSTYWGPAAATVLMTDSEATKANIIKFIQLYKEKGDAQTSLVFFFSGHGTNDNGSAALVTYDEESYELLTDRELTSVLTGNPCSAIFYIDACYSGGLIDKSNGRKAKVFTGHEGYDPEFAKGWAFDTEDDRGINEVDRLVAVTASAGDEVSWEDPAVGGGVFTSFLVQGLGADSEVIGPADTSGDGTISVEESYNYLRPLVIDYSTQNLSSVQTPQFVNNNAGTLVIK